MSKRCTGMRSVAEHSRTRTKCSIFDVSFWDDPNYKTILQ